MVTARDLGLCASILVAAAVVGLSGCGAYKPTVDADSAQQSVIDAVAKSVKVSVTTAKCPLGVEAKVDVKFDCTYTTSEGKAHVAHLTITKVEGSAVLFDITSDIT